MSVYLPNYLSFCLSIHPSVHPSIPSIHLLCLSVSLSFNLINSCYSHFGAYEIGETLFSLQFLNRRQLVGLLGRGISPIQGRYLHKHRINTNIRALNVIRTHDSSVRAGEDISCLRPRSHCDQLNVLTVWKQEHGDPNRLLAVRIV
jgi:hypothetical protein